jgi:hypothetical protein
MVVLANEPVPLLGGEEALRTPTQRPVVLALGPDDVGICAVIRRDLRFEPLGVSRITSAAFSTVLIRMCRPPTLHACARLLGVAPHPLTAVRATLLRISVRHGTLRSSALQ